MYYQLSYQYIATYVMYFYKLNKGGVQAYMPLASKR